MSKHIILGVHITDRMKRAVDVQKLFSEYGCHIKTRLGLHDVGKDYCAPGGLVLLEMLGAEKTCLELAKKLAKVEGVEVQTMVFAHA